MKTNDYELAVQNRADAASVAKQYAALIQAGHTSQQNIDAHARLMVIASKPLPLAPEGRWATISSLPRGECIRLSETAQKTYRKGDYDRSSKTFSLLDCDDINREIFRKGDKLVFVGFTY
jgi:hypothetical protein